MRGWTGSGSAGRGRSWGGWAATRLSFTAVRWPAGAAGGRWQDDPAQHPALRELDRLHAALLDAPRPRLLDRLFARTAAAPRVLYLWGGGGRGKTFLIDLFFDGRAL